eukprot:4866317-Amphidinium_carterae.2
MKREAAQVAESMRGVAAFNSYFEQEQQLIVKSFVTSFSKDAYRACWSRCASCLAQSHPSPAPEEYN